MGHEPSPGLADSPLAMTATLALRVGGTTTRDVLRSGCAFPRSWRGGPRRDGLSGRGGPPIEAALDLVREAETAGLFEADESVQGGAQRTDGIDRVVIGQAIVREARQRD